MDLDEWRRKIDEVDGKILALLNERFRAVLKIGALKKSVSSGAYVPEREKAVLDRLCALNQGPMSNTILRGVYREIMSGALSLESPMRVAYPGPESSSSAAAVISKFGRSAGCAPEQGPEEVFRAVAAGNAEYGCVPVENSAEGVDGRTLDLLGENPEIMICAEIHQRIRLALLSSGRMEEIRKIYATSTSFARCRRRIRNEFPGAELVETSSGRRALENAAGPFSAAIAPLSAAAGCGLAVLREKIGDDPGNRTRFLVISKRDKFSMRTGSDKTTLCFSIQNRVGALYDCLLPFREHHVALSMIESRPSRRKEWEYLFFIDLLGHAEDENVRESLVQLRKRTGELRILGSYPRGLEED